ncbi:M23 family metallopeptidase [Actinopolymorpha alba]|uniref:M23 family metallopeptidase n=1 Tax=Actinopolymorpha alba TaxID=533267 RepID=UPI0003603AF2|nr:M23 family metallopeptidase [Actinopolymorpha alba]
MAEPAKHRGGTAPADRSRQSSRGAGTSNGGNQRAAGSVASQRATQPGKRKKPGGHRKATTGRSFPTAPAVAGVATFVVAASGAVALNAVDIPASLSSDQQQAMPRSISLNAGQLQEARSAAADRANRSRRTPSPTNSSDAEAEAAKARAAKLAAERERAAWERERDKELQAVERKAADAKDEQVLERVIAWVLPVRAYRLSSGFGQSGSMWSANHTGQDFASPMGTPIRAVGDGEIISASYDGPYGNRIVLRHNDGTETWYCHMSRYALRSGYVKAGTTIGYVGSTGNSTGPHLHFEVHPGGGDPIDPLPWLRQLGLPI